ncbi:MAG: RnfABCDGE type electron transport complex subunit E [Candidatus Hadarchaeota archaeon]
MRQNPVFVLVLGLCPVLAITTRVENAIGMTAAFTFVILGSNLLISTLKKFIPHQVRIPTYIVIIASFVTIIEFILHAFAVNIYTQLGVFLPLITVNCIVLGRAEAFASKHPVRDSIMDTAGMSVGFGLAVITISAIRELFGTGKIVLFGYQITPTVLSSPVGGMVLPMGAFLTIGILLAVFRKTGVLK